MDEVLTDDVVQHIPGLLPKARSLAGFRQLLPALMADSRDVFFTAEDMVIEGARPRSA